MDAAPPGAEWWIAIATTQLVLTAIAFAGAAWSQRPVSERLGLRRDRLSPVRVTCLVVGMFALSCGLDGIIDWAGVRDASVLAEFELRMRGLAGAELGVALLVVGLLPAFGEELLCRGLVQRGLAARFGQPLAVVLAALLFGALHMDLVHGAAAVVLGLYLGSVTARADGIRPAIVCHGANNLLAVYTTARWPELGAVGPCGSILALLAACGCLALGLRGVPPASCLQISGGLDDR